MISKCVDKIIWKDNKKDQLYYWEDEEILPTPHGVLTDNLSPEKQSIYDELLAMGLTKISTGNPSLWI